MKCWIWFAGEESLARRWRNGWHWSPLLFQGKGKALVWSLNIKELTFLNPIHCQGQQVTIFEKCWSSSKQHLHHHKSQIKINPAPTPSKSIYASVSVPPGPIWKFLNFVATTTKKCELSMTSWQSFTRFMKYLTVTCRPNYFHWFYQINLSIFFLM